MANLQDGQLFKKYYQEVWHGLLPKVTIYYSPRRDLKACIAYGENTRFFYTIEECVRWAERNRMINDAAKVIKAVKEEADYLEYLDDLRADEADAQFRLNHKISQAGDIREQIRILRMHRDKWYSGFW